MLVYFESNPSAKAGISLGRLRTALSLEIFILLALFSA